MADATPPDPPEEEGFLTKLANAYIYGKKKKVDPAQPIVATQGLQDQVNDRMNRIDAAILKAQNGR